MLLTAEDHFGEEEGEDAQSIAHLLLEAKQSSLCISMLQINKLVPTWLQDKFSTAAVALCLAGDLQSASLFVLEGKLRLHSPWFSGGEVLAD